MKGIKTMIWLVVVALGLGISVLNLPQTANAQTYKDKKEKKQEREDDDNDKDEKLTAKDRKKAKITLEEARAIALKRVPGKVVEEELEKEKGRLQYAFDIRDDAGKIWDVEIDAVSGEVLYAGEDDEETDGDHGMVTKAGISVYRAANNAKNMTFRTLGKLF